ncbi:MAG: HAMP domain-containing sensor histidine kinase [Oscillospiraceae bacterium]|nr:HAMP domain-containing sensor histidine kinase [Oscillospiraceae bacterium]
MNSLYKRQFALTAGLLLISFCLLGIAFFFVSYQYTVNEKKAALERYADRVAQYTASYLASGHSIMAYENNIYWDMLDFFAEYSNSYLVLSNSHGQILCSTDGRESNYYKDSSIPASITRAIITHGEYAGTSTLGGLFRTNRLVVGKPVAIGNYMAGIIFAAADTSSVTEMWRAMISIFFITALSVLCIAFVSSSLASLRQTRPLKEMADATRKFGHGEFGVRVNDYGRKAEIGALASAFNAMAESLGQAEARRQEFVANISHELKTPMTTIGGFIDGILDGTIPPEYQQKSLEVISRETKRLSRLVRQMLDVSQLQSAGSSTQMSAFDITEVMRRILVGLEPKISRRRLDVDASLPNDPLLVWGNEDDIIRVGYNLLDNAIKFSPEGGGIRLSIAVSGGKAYVSVRNEGEEIAPSELPFIFDRFHKTDHSRSIDRDGVGLGLYIVKTILNNHNENITVTSKNHQTEFVFTLTCAKESDFGRKDYGGK